MNKELQQIKEKYGEDMMHFCRSNFSFFLETEGLLFKLLSEHFDYSKELFKDIEKQDYKDNFRNYIYSFIKVSDEDFKDVDKTPKELLSDAGYDFYECHNQNDILSFRKYYEKSEELCTFSDFRLNRCHVFFAVKKNVDKIKRENFIEPKRQDLYGTSVISIQFTRGNTNTLSIKNRYNHTVENPDATFSNNLENIKPGLTKAFEKQYNLNIKSPNIDFDLKNYCFANDKKFYKYNHEINNVYYCDNNLVIDNFEVKRFSKDRYILFEHYLLDMKEKTITLYDESIKDSFIDYFNDIKKIEIKKENDIKRIIINDNIEIDLDKHNKIVSYVNSELKVINDNFLCRNQVCNNLNIENVESVGNNCCIENRCLKNLNLPNVKSIGDNFFKSNIIIDIINIENVKSIGSNFLKMNDGVKSVTASNLQIVGDNFFELNNKINNVDFTSLNKTGNGFMPYNNRIKNLYLPNLEYVGNYFFTHNSSVESIYLPKISWVGCDFFEYNNKIEVLDMPNLTAALNGFFRYNKSVKISNLDNLKWIGDYFLASNQGIAVLSLPKAERIGDFFLKFNKSLKELYIPSASRIGRGFLSANEVLQYLYTQNLPKEDYDRIINESLFMKGNEYEEIKSNIKR